MLRTTQILLVTSTVIGACARRDDARSSVDTVMVFQATPRSAARESATAQSTPAPLAVALQAYAQRRITADSAARVVVDYLEKSGQAVNAEMDAPLRDAVKREIRRRHPQ